MSGVVPSEEFNRQLVATVRQVLRSVGPESGARGKAVQLTDNPTVKLSEDLAAAADGLDDDSLPSASADFLRPKTGGGWEVDPSRSIRLFNRSGSLYSAGEIGQWRMSLGKACFISDTGGGGGSGGASSGCCCCDQILFPTDELSDGTKTANRWNPCEQISPITWQHAEGQVTLTFPAPSAMVANRVDGEDYFEWTFDATDDIVTAVYEDGADATGSLSNVAGHLRFWLSTDDAQFGGGTVTGAELDFAADLAEQAVSPEPL